MTPKSCVFFLVVFAAGLALARAPDRQGKAEVGRPLPKVASVGIDPTTADSSERLLKLPGTRGLVVVFFATWCKPCVAEIEQLAHHKARLDQAGVRVLLVALLEDRARVARFVQEHDIGDWPAIWDGSGVIVEDFGLRDPAGGSLTLPLSIVTDGAGVVRAILRGGEDDYVRKVLSVLR